MTLHHYLFDNLANLIMARRQLKRLYPDLTFMDDLDRCVITVESKGSSFDQKVRHLLEIEGGILVQGMPY